MPHIPFGTLAERHLVYAYCAVWLLQFGYAGTLLASWYRTERENRASGSSVIRRRT